MTSKPLDFKDVLQLVELIESSSNFSEIRLRTGDVEVELRRHGASALAAPAAQPEQRPPAAPTATATTVASPAPVSAAARPFEPREGTTVVTAPMVGTVYRAPEPTAKPFVEVGQAVAPGDPLCIIEVMKLMNSISAECSGVITEIFVADGEAVQHGQNLFVISPAEPTP